MSVVAHVGRRVWALGRKAPCWRMEPARRRGAPERFRIGVTGKSTGKATARGRQAPMRTTCRMNIGRARFGLRRKRYMLSRGIIHVSHLERNTTNLCFIARVALGCHVVIIKRSRAAGGGARRSRGDPSTRD